MAWNRGDVVLIPFPYSDLSATKTRPTVVVSIPEFQVRHGELILAYLSSQLAQAHTELDYLLADWNAAGLLKPTIMRPRLAVIQEKLIVHHVGSLSERDLVQVNVRLQLALGLS